LAYDPERWHDAYLLLGTAAAALTGLVFVALSIHLRAIAGDRFQRARGEYLTFGLIYITVVSALVLIPGQGDDALGIELLVGGVVGALITGLPLARMWQLVSWTPIFRARVVVAAVAVGLDLAAGASLIARHGGGLYLLIAALMLAMVANVSGAWNLLVALTDD
jgi:hypothetical protein